MKTKDVLALLEENKNERGIEHGARLFPHAKLTSFGMGLPQLRKLAKQVGRDHDLALELRKSSVYDGKVLLRKRGGGPGAYEMWKKAIDDALREGEALASPSTLNCEL